MIITILVYVAILQEFGVSYWTCSSEEIDSVFLIPLGVTSKIQERATTIGKPMARAAPRRADHRVRCWQESE